MEKIDWESEAKHLAQGVLRLTKTIRYIVGIAERGEGRPIRDDEIPEQFVLAYVKRLEQEIARKKPAIADEIKPPRLLMTVKMQVTPAQALALQAMFDYWNTLACQGSSRTVGFFVDGDGNFKPNCKVSFSSEVPPLTEALRKAAVAYDDGHGGLTFDFDNIAWELPKS